MKKRICGGLGPVSEVAFGGGAISGEGRGYGFGKISKKESIQLLKKAYHLGINLFDTAPIYGFRESEKRMGEAFSGMRDKVLLVSKGGVDWHDNGRVNMSNDPLILEKMLERSLKDLKTDYIDLYMIHWPDKRVDIRDSMQVLTRAKQEGKIRFIGLCNTNSDEIKKATEVDKIDVLQSEFNLFNPDPIRNLFETVRRDKMGFMSWGTFDKGILTKRVTADRKFDDLDCRSWAPWWNKKEVKEKIEKLQKVWPILKKNEVTSVEMAMGFVLSHQEVSSALCGMRDVKQLESTLEAADRIPSKNILNEIIESLK